VVVVFAIQLVALGAAGVWSTYQHDAGRSGRDPDQAQVTSIAAAWTADLDGGMYAQPLAVGNTVYAATQANSVYAFVADTGTPLWHQTTGTPPSLQQVVNAGGCGNVAPYGIVSTPVIDTSNSTLYAVALQSSPTIHHELYALNTATGAVRYH
jgi:outer membrane protein assembly factor BamB